MASLSNARWQGAYPPPHLLKRGRCRRCCAVLSTRQEFRTDYCDPCWNRPLQWTDEQIDALLMDILKEPFEPFDSFEPYVPEEEEEPASVPHPFMQRILQGWWSKTMRDEALEDPDDE